MHEMKGDQPYFFKISFLGRSLPLKNFQVENISHKATPRRDESFEEEIIDDVYDLSYTELLILL